MLTQSAFELDRATNAIRFTRRIAAMPARLFEAWTQPSQVTLWWDPTGRPLEACEIDLRIGGRLRFQNAGAAHAFEGIFTLIDPPGRLAFEAMGAVGDLRFVADGTGTRMELVMTCSSPEHLEQFVQMGIATGTAQTLDNLATYLAPAT